MRLNAGMGVQLNGLDLVGIDELDVSWKTFPIDEWDQLPGTTGKATQNAYADGGWLDAAFSEPLAIGLSGRIFAPDRPSALAALRRFNAAVPVRQLTPLAVSEDGQVRYRLVRMEGTPKSPRVTDRYVTFDVQLTAPDPRMFAGDGSQPYIYSQSVGLPVSTGGLQVPVSVPLTVAATVVSGSVTIGNAGDAAPPVLITLTAGSSGLVNPTIRTTDGQLMRFGITLSARQSLVIDLDRRTVKINGTVSRRNTLIGSWITPSAGTTFLFDATVYNTDSLMTVQWSDAWS